VAPPPRRAEPSGERARRLRAGARHRDLYRCRRDGLAAADTRIRLALPAARPAENPQRQDARRTADRHRRRHARAARPVRRLRAHSGRPRLHPPGRLTIEGASVMTGESLIRDADGWSERLLADGYCVIPDLLPDAVAALDRDLAEPFYRTPFCEGGFYGARTKRFGRLLLRSVHAEALVRHPLVTAIVERVLAPWCDTIRLNLTQAIALHPGALPQLPHRDQDM